MTDGEAQEVARIWSRGMTLSQLVAEADHHEEMAKRFDAMAEVCDDSACAADFHATRAQHIRAAIGIRS